MKKINLVFIILLTLNISIAQQKTFEGVKKISMNAVDAIEIDNVVKGYYAFYFLEKKDRQNNNYLLEIMDSKLKTTQAIAITKPKNDMLLEIQFNGTHFCVLFLNQRFRTFSGLMYDEQGRKTGSFEINDIESTLIQGIIQNLGSEEGYYSGSLFPVSEKGFVVNYTIKENGSRYQLALFNSDGQKKWTCNSKNTESGYEFFSVLNSSSDYIVADFISRPKLYTLKGFTQETLIIDATTGELSGTVQSPESDNFYVISGVDGSAGGEAIRSFGTVYGGNKGKIDTKNNIGLFFRLFNKNGELINEKIVSWENELSSIRNLQKGSREKEINCMIHSIVKVDNKYYAIGELYNKEFSAGGLATKLLSDGRSGSVSKIGLYNLVTMVFDESFSLVDTHIHSNKKTNVSLPQGFATESEEQIGYYLKGRGLFNYNFIAQDKDKANFSVAYSVHKKDEIGVITLNDKGEIVNQNFELLSKPTAFKAVPAKLGYIMIFEYYRARKEGTLKLQKLDI